MPPLVPLIAFLISYREDPMFVPVRDWLPTIFYALVIGGHAASLVVVTVSRARRRNNRVNPSLMLQAIKIQSDDELTQ